MSDAISRGHPMKTTGSSAVSANTALTSTTCTPPFAPRPKQSQISTVEKTSTSDLPVSTADECNIHEFCYYFQQVLFIAAILTGSALVVAGSVMHIQSGEWLVFVYIGALLAGVNMVLLLIQCYIRKQQKQRSRLHYTNAKQRAAAVQYNSSAATKSKTVESHKQEVGHLNLASTVHQSVKDAPLVGTYHVVHSPTESQKRAMILMSSPPYRPSSVISQHRPKETYPRSPSLLHRSAYKTTNVPLQVSRYERSPQDCHLPAVPPPSYDDLICIGHLPHDGTSIHLI